MSRWRPPSEKSSPYITAEGHARLKAEFEQLWRVRRPEVVRALSAAAAEGDRSENAEYQYRKKELREIDARLKYLTLRLEDVKIVDLKPSSDGKVFFGAWIELADEDGDPRRYRIVGADEVDSARGWISVDSPVARALLGRAEGDSVKVRLPAGETGYEVVEVRYSAFDA
ncbi:MAG: transcription elongation factor GreB [Solimonas sp.]